MYTQYTAWGNRAPQARTEFCYLEVRGGNVVSVDEMEIDEYNEAEMARHGVTPIEALQVLDDDPRYYRNKKEHEAPYIMVGRTYGGRILTVPLAPTPVEGLWRPATAFDAGPYELARYRG